MSVDSKKTILLEKKYLYVRASLGFQLEGTSTEIIPTNNGFYRFYIDNLSKALGNSYVNILYDSNDLSFQSFCSDLYMDELMSSDSSAIEDVVIELQNNTKKIEEFENGVSSALESNHQDNVALSAKIDEFQSGVSTGMASNHADNVAISTLLEKFTENNFYFSVPSASIGLLSSRGGDLTFGVASDNVFYLLDVDKFSYYPSKIPCWKLTENINVRCAKSFYTYIDSVFDFPEFQLNCTSYMIDRTIPKHNLILASMNRMYFVRDISANRYYSYTDLDFPYLVICTDFELSVSRFSKLVFASHSKKYSKYSFIKTSSHPILYFPCVDPCSTCCINQNVEVPLTTDYLNFSFDCNLDLALVKSLTYHFVTDIMDLSFTGEELQLYYPSSSPHRITTGSYPNLHPEGSPAPSLLLKVYVTK